jgi:hypothetical protein
MYQDCRQASVPFTSSNSSSRKTSWVDFGKSGRVADPLHEKLSTDAIERVLLDVRAARVSYFVQSGSTVEDRIVFIS